MICVVRNPMDAIVSNFNLAYSFTHDKLLEQDCHKDFTEFYEAATLNALLMWSEWHKRILIEAREKKIPIYFLRYEDLTDDPLPNLIEAFKFILGVDSIEGTNVERRIKEVVEQGTSKTRIYNMK